MWHVIVLHVCLSYQHPVLSLVNKHYSDFILLHDNLDAPPLPSVNVTHQWEFSRAFMPRKAVWWSDTLPSCELQQPVHLLQRAGLLSSLFTFIPTKMWTLTAAVSRQNQPVWILWPRHLCSGPVCQEAVDSFALDVYISLHGLQHGTHLPIRIILLHIRP